MEHYVPQTIIIMLLLFSLVVSCIMHGEKRTISFPIRLFDAVMLLLLLWWGGFFG